MKVRNKKRSAIAAEKSNSFLYRGVRITRTWTRSERRKEIAEAMLKVLRRGPMGQVHGADTKL